jgi:hypothetical protein
MADTVNSEVPKVELDDDGNIALTIQVVGFAKGKSVEVYGYLTQPSGAFASFRETRDIPEADPTKGASELMVTVPREKLKLEAGQPVTVLTWVSEFWPSMLKAVATSETGQIRPAWEIDRDATGRWRSLSRGRGRGARRHGPTPVRTRLTVGLQPAGPSRGSRSGSFSITAAASVPQPFSKIDSTEPGGPPIR